jgi:hypothetical protein
MTSVADGLARLRRLTSAARRGDTAAQVALAEALFCTSLQPSSQPSTEDVRRAVRQVLLRHGGDTGTCLGTVARRYGDDQERAGERMRWCRNVVAVAYAGSDPAEADDGDNDDDDDDDNDGSDGVDRVSAERRSAYLRELFWRRAHRP